LPQLIVAQPLTHQNFAALGDLIAPAAHDGAACWRSFARRPMRAGEGAT
jgi:ureidoglycolate hydrolase